jgi:hypothetical protein
MRIGAWLCLMAGTLLRAPSQALYTIVGGPFVPLLGLSGLIQVVGLMLFVWNLWKTLTSSATEPAAAAARPAVSIGASIPTARREKLVHDRAKAVPGSLCPPGDRQAAKLGGEIRRR